MNEPDETISSGEARPDSAKVSRAVLWKLCVGGQERQ